MPNANRWMTDYFSQLSSRRLKEIVFPGSHDSGMSELHGNRALIPIEGPLTKSQSLNTFEQLVTGGARYLDLRPVHYIASGASNIPDGDYTAHYSIFGAHSWIGLMGRSVADVCDDLAKAMAQLGSKEIVLIEISSGMHLSEGGNASSLSDDAQHRIIGHFIEKLGPFLYKSQNPNLALWDLKLADVVSDSAPGPKIFLWNGDTTYGKCGFMGVDGFFAAANLGYYNSWYDANTDKPATLISDLRNSLLKYAGMAPPKSPYLLTWHCTGMPGSNSLEEMARDLNPLFADSVADWLSTGVINNEKAFPTIIPWDYMSDPGDGLLETCIRITFGIINGLVEHVILSDRSTKGMAITSLGGRLYIAWTGMDGQNKVNLMYSSDGGRTFGNKYESSERSAETPELCTHNGNLYMAWRGDGNDRSLHIAQVMIDGERITGVGSIATTQSSHKAPSIMSFGDRMYLAWTGLDNKLNLMYSVDNGRNWGWQLTSNEGSLEPPTLGTHMGSLYVTWKGTDKRLNIAQVMTREGRFGPTVTIGETSDAAPSIASLHDRLYIAWRGTTTNLNVMHSHDAKTFTGKYESSQTTPRAPELCMHADRLYITWSGTDNHLNIAQLQFT